jgi:two-component system, LytTR family, sensor kinase
MTNREKILLYLGNRRWLFTNLLFWVIIYLLLMAIQFFGGREGDYYTLFKISITAPLVIFVFYSNFFLCELFFLNNRTKYFLYNLLLFIPIIAAGLYVTGTKIAIPGNIPEAAISPRFIYRLFTLALTYVTILLLSALFWSLTYAAKKNKENLTMQLRLQHMENEKIHAEKQFLQSQINPHFLYNTLNFFYAKSLTHSPQLAESVLLLSNIMRYSLEQKENSSGMVYLEDEINHINNFIRINQFRFNNQLQIQFLVSGNTDKVRIVPLVLITLVENAFKHGEMLDAGYPVAMALVVNEAAQTISFEVRNKKSNGPKEKGTGIGLENTKRRLAFTYKGTHQMGLKNEEEFYLATLQLPLFKDT